MPIGSSLTDRYYGHSYVRTIVRLLQKNAFPLTYGLQDANVATGECPQGRQMSEIIVPLRLRSTTVQTPIYVQKKSAPKGAFRLALVRCVVLLSTDFPQVRPHGLFVLSSAVFRRILRPLRRNYIPTSALRAALLLR